MSGVTADEQDEELLRVVAWRRTALERAGYEKELADILSASLDVDLHDAIALLQAGCKQSLAVLILL